MQLWRSDSKRNTDDAKHESVAELAARAGERHAQVKWRQWRVLERYGRWRRVGRTLEARPRRYIHGCRSPFKSLV
jgi:hypothetical protein